MTTDLVQTNTTLATAAAGPAAELPPAQIAALDSLLAGKTATAAAAAAGISRTTLYAWLGKDFRFQAALNRGRRDMRQALNCRVEQLAAEAADCVAGAVRRGDVKAALEILRRANVFTLSHIGSDNEAVLQLEEQKRQLDRETNLALSRRSHKSVSREY
jgi:hypothetical protein